MRNGIKILSGGRGGTGGGGEIVALKYLEEVLSSEDAGVLPCAHRFSDSLFFQFKNSRRWSEVFLLKNFTGTSEKSDSIKISGFTLNLYLFIKKLTFWCRYLFFPNILRTFCTFYVFINLLRKSQYGPTMPFLSSVSVSAALKYYGTDMYRIWWDGTLRWRRPFSRTALLIWIRPWSTIGLQVPYFDIISIFLSARNNAFLDSFLQKVCLLIAQLYVRRP